MYETVAVFPVMFAQKENTDDHDRAYPPGNKGGNTGSGKAEFRKSEISVDQQIVAHHIAEIGSENDPHWHACTFYPVAPLPEHIE